MAVSSITPLPKSQPDISKLNTFTGYVVSVTKHLGPRGTVGTGVISSKIMSKDQVFALQDQLAQSGAGYYAITVTDAGGSGDDTWMVKLGPDIPQQQESFNMGPGSNGASGGFSGAPPALGEGVIHLGHNFFYNEAMGTLTTPWRTIVSWKQGDPMPQPPTAQTSSAPYVPPPSQWGQTPQMGGWGGYPVNDDSSKVKALETQLAEYKRDREMSELRQEQRRQQDDTNKRIDAQAELTRQMFEKLTDALTKKPSGPSEELRAIQAQNEKLERQLEQDRRDVQARERDAQTREEMRRQKDDTDRIIRELSTNKSDPMLPMLMQVMQTGNQNAMEAIKAIQSTTSSANTATERQVNMLVEQLRGTITSPVQMMQMMQSARGDGAEMAKMMLETTKDTMSMQRNVFEQLLDVAGQGNQPAWLQAVEALANKVGPIGEALVAKANQPRTVIQRVAVPVDAQGRPIQQGPMQQPNAGAIAGAPGTAPPQGTAPTEIRNSPTEAAAEPAKKTRGKKGKAKPPVAHTLAEIRDMDPDALAKEIEDITDEALFGETLLGYVNLLRENVVKGMLPEQVAGTLWDRRPQLLSLTPVPGAVELFMAEQISVLVERLLPDVNQEFHDKVVEGIEERLVAEAEGTAEGE